MILITGATGLSGAHLTLHLLRQGEAVRALYRTPESRQKTKNLFDQYGEGDLFERIDWHQADILDIPALEGAFVNVSTVYHCAAVISFNREDEELLRKVNIEGTANMVNLSLAHGVRQFCHMSSVAAIGDPIVPGGEITEECEWNPAVHYHDYAISKFGGEMEVWRGFQEGLGCVIVNPGIIIGPGFWGSGSGQLFSSVAGGLKFYTHGVTGYIGVWDVVRSMHALTERKISGERYILVAENLSYKQIITEIALRMNVKKPDVFAHPWLTELGWRLDWLLSVFGKKRKLSKEAARSLHKVSIYSSAKIQKELSVSFEPVSDVVQQTVTLQKGMLP